MANYTQVTKPNLGVKDGLGWCLRFTQSAFAAPVAYPTARKAWDGQRGRHMGVYPPLGITVPIWLNHWGTYGGTYGNFGHVAVRLADGRVFTSPMHSGQTNWLTGKGSAIYKDIPSLQAALGGSPSYLGWSEYMNGKQIVKVAKATPSVPSTPNKPSKGGKEVIKYHNENRESRVIKPKERLWLTHSSGEHKGKKQNCGGKPGEYIITGHVYGDGFAPGDILELRYTWEDSKTGKESHHYLERLEADRHGMIRASCTFQRRLANGYRIYASVYAGSANKKNGRVTLLDSDAMQFIG